MAAGELSGMINDCDLSVGLQIGETSGMYSREVNFGRHSIQMGRNNLSIYDDNTDNGNANAFPSSVTALSVLRAKGGEVTLTQCMGDISIGPQVVSSSGVSFKAYVPEDQKRYSRTIDGSANAVIGFLPYLDHSTGKLPIAMIPDLTGDATFIEGVQDIVGGMMVAGTGITVAYDDALGKETITATGTATVLTNELSTEYTTTSPAKPGTGTTIFSRKRAGRRRLAQRGATDNVPSSVQTLLGTNKTRFFTAQGNGTTVSNTALASSSSGTATARNVAITNDFTMFSRIGYVAASAAINQVFGIRHGALQFARANSATGKNCGFEYIARWGMAVVDGTNGALAVGMFSTASALTASAEPSAQTSCIFIGKETGDTNLSIFCNDGSGTCTKTDLGASFPGNTANTDMYETRFFAEPNGGGVYWSCHNLITDALTEGYLTTDIPPATTLLAPQIWGSTRTSTVAMGIDVVSQYVETDY
jgi:hypothetical protein